MLVISPFHPGDAKQALRMFRWISELEGQQMPHDLMLIADTRCSEAVVKEIEVAAKESFRSVEKFSFVDHFKRWPDAPNAVFARGARHVMANQKVPWLFLEPDCCPLKAGWLDAIEAEYKAAGKPFMGARVEVGDIPLHMSGNAVYPVDMFAHGGNALIAGDVAFDMVGASQIIPQAHFTNIIEHAWNHPTFDSWKQVEREVSKEAVLYHASKDGSLIDRLREHKNNLSGGISTTVPAEGKDERFVERLKPTLTKSESLPPAPNLTCDLFLKTYPADYPWAEYCLRSIDKFCTGFRRVMIVAPDEACPRPSVMPHNLVVVPERENGYNWQQVIKLSADQYTDADFVLFADSDTIFTRPVTPETFLKDGKPVWLMTPFEKARDDQKAAWIPVMTEWMGKPPEFEFMRRHPFMFPRWLLEAARDFCQQRHRLTIEQYVMSRTFSEFNCAGFLAYDNFCDKFAWLNTETDEIPDETTLQKWSYAGLSVETKAEFEKILSGAGEQTADAACVDPPAQNVWSISEEDLKRFSGGVDYGIGESQTVFPPWHSKEQSVAEIKYLAERLQKFCTGGAKTRRVREELHALGVVELPYRFKRRNKWRKRKAKA